MKPKSKPWYLSGKFDLFPLFVQQSHFAMSCIDIPLKYKIAKMKFVWCLTFIQAQKPPATLVFTNTDIKQFSATMQCWWFWISMPQHKSHFHLKVFRGECHQYCLYIYNEESTDHPFWIGPRFTKNGLSWFDPVQGLKFYLVPIRFGPRFLKLFGSGPWFPVYNERFSFEDIHSISMFLRYFCLMIH